MTVEILIPCYNSEEKIMDVVESILSQTYQDFKVTFFNNASSDLTYDIIQTVCEADSRFSIINRITNIGASLNIHAALTHIKNGYFALLADDMVIEPTYLECCLDTLVSNTDAILCYTGVKLFSNGKFLKNYYDAYRLVDDSFEVRMCTLSEHLSLGTAVYGVYRADLIQDIRRFWCNLSAIRLGDLQFLLKVAYRGKIIQISSPLIRRNIDDPSADYYTLLLKYFSSKYPRKLLPFIAGIYSIAQTVLEDTGNIELTTTISQSIFNRYNNEIKKEIDLFYREIEYYSLSELTETLLHMVFLTTNLMLITEFKGVINLCKKRIVAGI
jgi:glycosyltransferase involved in cell wall biosynthesis